MPNAYHGFGSKFAHPCYHLGEGYVCPECGEAFKTTAPMEWHYLRDHDTTLEEAKEVVAPSRYGKHFKTDEWKKKQLERKEANAFRKKARAAGWAIGGFGMWWSSKEKRMLTADELKDYLTASK